MSTALGSPIGTFSGRGRHAVPGGRLVKSFLCYHKMHLDQAASSFRQDYANHINEAPFQMRLSEGGRYTHPQGVILEGECSGTLTAGCINGWLHCWLQPVCG